jgi:predicted phosphodiesterase
MMDDLLSDKIKHLAETTHMNNAEIARKLFCSERSVRRYAGEWKSRMMRRRSVHAVQGGERKAFLMYDPHIPYHDLNAYAVAINYAKEWQPDDVIIGGDFADFKHVSFWKDAPGRANFSDEIAIVKGYLTNLRNVFPLQRIIYLEGNHEARLARYLYTKAPELYGLPELTVPTLLKLDDLDIQYVSNISLLTNGQSPLSLGKLFVLHGHEVKMSWDGINLARTMYLRTHRNVIFGHHHQAQHFTFKKLDGKHDGSWMVGGLCQLSEAYQPMNNWIHGFATVKYNPVTGYFKVRNKIILDGQVL